MNRILIAAAMLLAASPSVAWAASAGSAQTIAAIPLDGAAISFGAAVVQAHAQALHEATPLRPAPLPDPDVSPPGGDTLSAEADPSLAPGIFNPQKHFSGDGYARGSSIESSQNHRTTPGGGMSLSIPMQ